MQTLAAYVMLLLVMVAVGLTIIFGAVVSLAIYEGIASMKSRPEFQAWQHSLPQGLRNLGRELREPLFHAHR